MKVIFFGIFAKLIGSMVFTKNRNFYPYLLLVASMFILSSCDMFMDDSVSPEVSTTRPATCKLETEAFSYIFERNIKGDILCLEQNLYDFMDLVETDRPGYVSRKTLIDFIENGPFDDIDPEVVRIVEGLFDISYLVFGGDRGYLTRSNVADLTQLLIFINEHIWKAYYYFSRNDDVNYNRHEKEKKVVFDEFNLISEKVRSVINLDNRQANVSINLEKLISDFLADKPETVSRINNLLYIKRLFFGGERTRLTFKEFEDVIYKLPFLASVSFDLAKIEYFDFSQDQHLMINLFNRDVTKVKSLLFYRSDDLVEVMNIFDLMKTVDEFFPELKLENDFDIFKYPKEIETIKSIFLGESGPFFSSNEVMKLLDIAESLLLKGDLFYRVYDQFKSDLNSNLPITYDFSAFPVNNNFELRAREHFARIARDYKFHRGSLTMPIFHHDYYRNPNAMFEIALIEFVVESVMKVYGNANEMARGGYTMSLEQTKSLIDDIRRILRDQGIITIGRQGGGETGVVTDNLVLMSTLFQYQSDGCVSKGSMPVCLEIPELTEFLIGLVSAIQVKNFFTDKLETFCQNEMDQYNRISVSCFRENFINVLEQRIDGDTRSISDYMPLLYQYLKEMTDSLPDGSKPTESADYIKFLEETEEFTRTCTYYDEERTEEVPMKSTDAFAVFAGLMNVESTIIRHDKNRNNYLDADKDYNEVMNAYNEVFEGAIKGLVAPNGGFLERIAKPTYLYLIKYGKAPDTSKFKSIMHFLRFMLRFNKREPANRTTIATILKVIGEQNSTNPFKCEECLRDPTVTCEPDDGPWPEDYNYSQFR